MGMEVTGSDLVHGNGETKVEETVPNLHEGSGKVHSGNGLAESIKFGSHVVDEPAKVGADNASNANFPKSAVEEWPAEPQIHSFYIIKYRSYDDPNLKAKIDQADKEIAKRNQQRFQILEGLKAKRSDRAQVIGQLKSLGVENKQYGQVMDEKINQMKPLKEALGSLRGSNNAGREKGAGLCSSEEELNELIRSLNYRMQHEVISLTEEKQILREIKQLEGTREKVIANAAMRAKIQDSLGQKDVIQDQVKLIGSDLDGVKKERQVVRSKIKVLEDELKAIDSDINSLQQDLASVTDKRDKAFETIYKLRKQRDEGNACYYQNRSLLNNAKELAAKKNIKALEDLASAEVEKFMSSWNSSKAFRDDYDRRILVSLDMRQMSRDGRMRNPTEKPLVLVEQTKPAEAVTLAKPTLKVVKEEAKPPKEQESIPAPKAQKESKKKQAERGVVAEPRGVEEEEYFVVEKLKQEKVVDEAKLKEIRRQEEMEKQKQALERKKKLAEKAAAKAAIRVRKEAEKKQKEREKKLKKKEAVSVLSSSQDEATENEADAAEAENSDKAEENAGAEISGKTRELKDTSSKLRRRGQPKRRDSALPKAILKKKKSSNYWLWAALAVVVVLVLVLLALMYKYAI